MEKSAIESYVKTVFFTKDIIKDRADSISKAQELNKGLNKTTRDFEKLFCLVLILNFILFYKHNFYPSFILAVAFAGLIAIFFCAYIQEQFIVKTNKNWLNSLEKI